MYASPRRTPRKPARTGAPERRASNAVRGERVTPRNRSGSSARLKGYIKTIGLYNTKAKNVIRLSEMLVEQYDSQVPEDRVELEKLPGVG